ncbi:hypothetical protein SAMN05446589_4131 [Streptomyces sp. OV198]|uniref:hypothetical protein n=1 Tax=Streptomyces sp. OV198 TaxID=1882787 RepID=UPI000BD969B3|nr:hypothetical protein [Streptomyces sp. OV198]SOE71680.1 hypothetical protein SAMN05446589_4131 [Streptomyces sp. OV198]
MKVPTGPSGPYRLLARALTAGVLVSASACSLPGVMKHADAPPIVPPATSATPSLTDAQASAALITQGELGGRWSATQGGATWRDGLLKTRTDAPDCQRLLDGLYAEDLLGEPTGARAVVGLDESGNAAQLRYQVAAYAAPSEVDAKLAWLRTLPSKCAQFTSTDVRGGQLNVTVVPAVLPGVGDAREGLRLTMSGASPADAASGAAPMLTLDFAAVRVGDRAVSLTNGGLGGAAQDSTQQAVQVGTQRLQDVLAGRPPTTQPAAPSTAPAAPSTAPAAPTTAPLDSLTEPAAPTSAPRARRTAPAAPTTAPRAPRTAPAAPRTEPVDPRTEPVDPRTGRPTEPLTESPDDTTDTTDNDTIADTTTADTSDTVQEG